MKITRKNVLKYHSRLVKLARKALESNDANNAADMLSVATTFAYQFNLFYTDPETESLIKSISNITLRDNLGTVAPKPGRVVFYDAFALDNRGLTQQYIRGLMELGVEFLFIYENKEPAQCRDIQQELANYGRCTVFELDRALPATEKIRTLYSRIADYAPSDLLLHIAPWSIEALAVSSALPEIRKYNVNLTDHAYWAGASIIDYNIEFRNYGATVSTEKRGLKEEQLILLPYYPITRESGFKGFPEMAAGKTVIFSGGALYKIYGENGAFFGIVKRLLEENPDTALLFAGGGNSSKFTSFIEKNGLQDRIALLGNRSDIDQVFKHCDIYLGTYPFCGGLMSQFAAVNAKPILAYTDPKYATNYIEGIVCHNDRMQLTYDDPESFFAYTRQLCTDPALRERIGRQLAGCVITPARFAEELKTLLGARTTSFSIGPAEKIDYEAFADMYLEVENDYLHNGAMLLLAKFRFKAFVLFPKTPFIYLFKRLGFTR